MPVLDRSPRQTLLASVHGVLLLSVLPMAVLWIPLLASPDFGNFTVLDLVLALLWATTLIRLATKERWSSSESRALRIAAYAVAIGLFGLLAAVLYGSATRLTSDLLQHGKRFGFPAILPLALLMCGRKELERVRVAGVAALVFTVVSSYAPVADALPISSIRMQDVRATGSLGNANELGYIAVFGGVLGLSHMARTATARGRVGVTCIGVLAVAAGLVGLTGSGSRSALVAAVGATIYIVFKRTLSLGKKVVVVAVLVGSVITGWQVSSVYQDRLRQVLEEKTGERSTSARMEMQEVALRAWLHHPLGIGFRNWEPATFEFSQSLYTTGLRGSDSIYVDFLLSSGAFGFVCLLLCLRNCWRLGRFDRAPMERLYLNAGVIAAFCMGFATVCPASVCVAPFFFVVVGLAGSVRETPRSRSYVRTISPRQSATRYADSVPMASSSGSARLTWL